MCVCVCLTYRTFARVEGCSNVTCATHSTNKRGTNVIATTHTLAIVCHRFMRLECSPSLLLSVARELLLKTDLLRRDEGQFVSVPQKATQVLLSRITSSHDARA